MIHNLVPKSSDKFFCEKCDYSTSRKSQYLRHTQTDKHKRIHNDTELGKKSSQNVFQCQCGNIYKHHSGYYRHKKVCLNSQQNTNNELDNKTTVTISKEEYISFLSNTELIKKIFEQNIEIVNQNKDVVQQNIQLQHTIVEMSKNSNNTINNTITNNSNNKTAFNINFFLNETCKNAMNLSDFVDTVIPTLEELENTGRLGHSEGVSKIITARLKDMERELRPLHCSDGKREIFYVKENDTWNKETDDKPLLIGAIKQITQKNIKNIFEWIKKHPGCTDAESMSNDMYLKIMLNSMSGGTKEETDKNLDKIITQISKQTLIDRNLIT
jgi:hypothetical protein